MCRLQDEELAYVVSHVHFSFRICDIDSAVWPVVEAGFNRMRRISNIDHAQAGIAGIYSNCSLPLGARARCPLPLAS
ncbi:hypothetical protein, partial [Roseiflexus sp.]|uniref:hypothetical protein n=1 Tax=Roseiflexus sp. TaxID=2562120 RepID=UPI00398B899F